jgi:hypothetical protein
MAKLSAHGSVVGTVEYITKAKRYMSDGVILRNNGFGWKLAGKVNIAPRTAYENAAARLAEKLTARPSLAAYVRTLHAMTGLCNRWKLHAAVSLMPDDPDGCWSEACDGYGDNVHADLDDVVELCMLYRVAMRELADAKAELATT